jgi:acyl dehydratase
MATMPVELGKVREYALATGAVGPAYLADPAAPIPPTFLSTVVYWESLQDVLDAPETVAALAAHGVVPDVGRLLSVEQEYRFAPPLPRAGEVLETRLRFDGVTAKDGRRGGPMLFVRFAVEFLRDGDRVAECRYTSAYLPGGAPSSAIDPAARRTPVPRVPDPPRGPADDPGQELPPMVFGPVTMTDVVRYQGASGDLNPMHHDDELARAHGYPAAFGVGMLGAGYLATYCCAHYGVETVRRFRTRFRDLVWRGDTLVASARVTQVVEAEAEGERRVELALRLTTDAGGVAVTGSAEFAVPA